MLEGSDSEFMRVPYFVGPCIMHSPFDVLVTDGRGLSVRTRSCITSWRVDGDAHDGGDATVPDMRRADAIS
jgi:hypothetical protein